MKTTKLPFFALSLLLAGMLSTGLAAPIHEAARKLDVAEVQRLLDAGADVNARDETKHHEDETPLMNAVAPYGKEKINEQKNFTAFQREWLFADNREMVKLLLSKGADLNAKDKLGRTALMQAIFHGSLSGNNQKTINLEIVKLLLENGADVNAKTNGGNTPLMEAVGRGTELLGVLLDRGADVNAKCEYGTALKFAFSGGKMEEVKLLLEHGAIMDDEVVQSALGSHSLEIATLAMEKGANIQSREPVMNRTLLHQAVYTAMQDLSMMALNKDKDPAMYEKHKANRAQDLKIIKLLLDKGSDTAATDKYGKTALDDALGGSASDGCDAEVAELLLDRIGDINIKNKAGASPLMQCVAKAADNLRMGRYNLKEGDQKMVAHYETSREGYLRLLERLLAKGADINVRDKNGDSPLYKAIYGYDYELAKWLLDKGADANAKIGYSGDPILFMVLTDDKRSPEAPKWLGLLLEKGGDVNSKRKDGVTLLLAEVSAIQSCMQMIPYYEKKGDSARAKVEKAAYASHLENINFLLEKGADVNAENDGESSLRVAVLCGNVELTKLLLEKKPDIDAPDKDGWTPLMRAISSDKCPNEIITLLLDHGADPALKTEKANYSALELAANGKFISRLQLMETKMCGRLEYAVKALSMDNPKITDALITAQATQLPNFLATATTEQKVALLTTVNQQIAKAKVRMGELNEEGRAAIRKGKDGSTSRKSALQVGAYMDVLKEIKAILEGS